MNQHEGFSDISCDFVDRFFEPRYEQLETDMKLLGFRNCLHSGYIVHAEDNPLFLSDPD